MAGRLFIFVGPSGAGKSTIAEGSGLYVEPKRSTRPGRNYEEFDVISEMSCDLRDNDTFVGYTNNGGHIYMFDLVAVRQRLDSGKDVVIITSEPQTIRYLKEELANVCVVFVHRSMTRERIRQICRERGTNPDKVESDVEQRYAGLITLYNDLATGVLRPDHVILNTEEDVAPAVAQFQRIISHRRAASRSVAAPMGEEIDGGTLFIIMAGTGAFKVVIAFDL